MPPLFNSRGERQPETMTIVIRRGFGIVYEGKHIERGPHRVTSEIAVDLIRTRRAEEYDPEVHDAQLAAERGGEGESLEPRDPQPEHRDDLALRTRGGKQR